MERRARVLEALRAAAGAAVSGEALADALGVSRAAVAKHVAALRDAGYGIEAEPGTGYRLVAVPQGLVPAEVAGRVSHPLWVRFEGGGVTGSTNEDAKRLARADVPEGTVVLARAQTQGKGRMGRTWESPEGGVYLSAVLRPALAPAEAPPLALVVALGVARGLETLGATPRLKWPNDVLAGDGKLAGVLVEMSAEADRVRWVVAGCGMNVRRPGKGPSPGAAHLEDTVPGTDEVAAAVAALDGIGEAYAAFAEGGFGVLRDEYEARSSLTGSVVEVRDADGGEVARGLVSGVDESGRLVLETPGGDVAVSAGEVTLRR